MIPATIPPPPGQQIDIGPLSIHYYGVLIGIGALLAIALGRRRYAALGGDPDLVDRVGVVGVLAGLLGARAAYVITHFSLFVDRPLAVFALWEGGLAIFGGLLVGVVAGIWYARRLGMPLAPTLDAIIPGLPLGQAIGRWGNYFNQELYGTPTTLPWALEVEPARRVPEYAEFATFHPTFLYESLLNLCLVAVLLWVDRTRLRQGSIIWVYFAGYGFIRFWVELLRTDTTYRLLGLSRNNWVALLAFVVGLVGLRWWQRRAPDVPMGTPIAHADAPDRAERDADADATVDDGDRTEPAAATTTDAGAGTASDDDAGTAPVDDAGAGTAPDDDTSDDHEASRSTAP
ncbi:MAG TPA: prolipoprotein diacylglyceryl transferase [Euzebyales bacterium]|nr:prolipoprotein diacylglyceryl transferase [Euzebyales bacterium]